MKTEEKNQDQQNQLPEKLQAVVTSSGVELSKAESIAANYAPLMQEARELAGKLEGLTVENEDDVAKAKEVRLELGRLRSRAKNQKSDDKQSILVQGRFVDALFNTVEGYVSLTQQDAEKIEKHAERQEQIRLDALEEERKKLLEKYEIDPSTVDCRNMIEDVWKVYIEGVERQYKEKKEAEEKAEAERIEQERRQKIYDDRIKQLLVFDAFNVKYNLSVDTTDEEFAAIVKTCEKAKAKAIEEQKKQKLHTDRITELSSKGLMKHVPKETDTDLSNLSEKEFSNLVKHCEAEDKKEVDARLAREAEQEKQRKEVEAKRKAEEQKRKDAEAEAKRLRDAEEARKKEEAEAKAKAEKEAREAAKAPDIEKLTKVINELHLELPEIKDANVLEVANEVLEKFGAFKDWATAKLQNVK